MPDATPEMPDEAMPDAEPNMPEAPEEPLFLRHPVPGTGQEIMTYMLNGTLPDDILLARRIQSCSKAYTIINHELYKRSVTGVLQHCVEPAEVQEILTEIHQGECGHHVSSRAL